MGRAVIIPFHGSQPPAPVPQWRKLAIDPMAVLVWTVAALLSSFISLFIIYELVMLTVRHLAH